MFQPWDIVHIFIHYIQLFCMIYSAKRWPSLQWLKISFIILVLYSIVCRMMHYRFGVSFSAFGNVILDVVLRDSFVLNVWLFVNLSLLYAAYFQYGGETFSWLTWLIVWSCYFFSKPFGEYKDKELFERIKFTQQQLWVLLFGFLFFTNPQDNIVWILSVSMIILVSG